MKPMPRTPCRGICSTGIDGITCRGCKRFDHEVIAWNTYSTSERFSILARLEQFTVRAMETRCRILDREHLLTKVREHKIRFDETADPFCWLYELLRAGASQIQSPEEFGFEVLSEYRTMTLDALYEDAERALLALSDAHFERYFTHSLKEER